MAVVTKTTPLAAEPAERVETDRLGATLERPLFGVLPWTTEHALYALIVLVAAALRLWELGPRMLHHDESLHALYSWYLYTGRGYAHDPMMHGPFLFEWGALLYFLFGATDAVARLGTSLFGILLVGFAYLTRPFIGRTAALIAAALLATAPTVVYYSRFDRHDIYLAVFQFLFTIAIFRYLRTQRTGELWLMVAALAFAFATKEDTYLQLAYLTPFLVFLCRKELGDIARLVLSAFGVGRGPRRPLSPVADVAILIGTVGLPLIAGGFEFVLMRLQVDVDTSNTILVAVFALLAIAGALVGLRWNPRVWVTAAVIFWAIFIAQYTTFFSNPGGLFSGAIGGLKYWIDQQGVARGNQPWFYYLLLLPLYEFVAVLFGIGGAIYLLRRRTLFGVWLVYWAFGAVLLYGWAAEKMPWMVIHMAVPLIFLAAVAIGRLVEQTQFFVSPLPRFGLFLLTLFLASAAFVSGTARLFSAGGPDIVGRLLSGGAMVQQAQASFQSIGLLIVGAVLLYFALTLGRRLGRTLALKVAALGALLLVLLPLAVRTAWQVNFHNGDVPVEMLVYTQTSPDVGQVMDEIDRIAFRTGQGRDKVKIVYDSGVSWPFEWYLRDYKGRVFVGAGNIPANALDAPIVLVGMENNRDQTIKQQLGSRYVGQRYRLRWWFPEDYRSITLDSFRWFLFDSATRSRIWRYVMFRETLNPLGSTDFMLFVRRELVAGAWAAPQAGASGVDEEVYQRAARQVSAAQAFGGQRGSQPGQFADPKNLATAPDGSLYVVDTFNHRIQKFDRDGKFVLTWGSEGSEDGQFKEPWGIAVSPSGDVYVADTWNHRIQRFDGNGAFKAKWGGQQLVANARDATGSFFGPRAIAIDQSGSVLVTDTGNHRVQRFDAEGKFLSVYGGRGAGEGLFAEPVGVALDRSGNVYVADTWNRRVQKLDPNGKFLAEWPIVGWESESVVNKPYLAVDADGAIYLTDPELHRVVKLSAAGQVMAVWGKPGRDQASLNLPTGIAVAPGGDVWVADSQNHRILKFAPIR
ncbi:MAG TPA: flippase activity-associated protein Agl23 [Chloroflexota bacterium]|nr:flippase activity-associated protein Agl23 [Chloroflexota bacterium]